MWLYSRAPANSSYNIETLLIGSINSRTLKPVKLARLHGDYLSLHHSANMWYSQFYFVFNLMVDSLQTKNNSCIFKDMAIGINQDYPQGILFHSWEIKPCQNPLKHCPRSSWVSKALLLQESFRWTISKRIWGLYHSTINSSKLDYCHEEIILWHKKLGDVK